MPKLFGVNSWILQMIRLWIADCWSGGKMRGSQRKGKESAGIWRAD